MKIDDLVPETLNCQITLAISEKQSKRWDFLLNEFKKLPKKPVIRDGLRDKFDEYMTELELLLKEYKSKTLDFTGID